VQYNFSYIYPVSITNLFAIARLASFQRLACPQNTTSGLTIL